MDTVNVILGLMLVVVGVWMFIMNLRGEENRWEIAGIPLTYWFPLVIVALGVSVIVGVVDFADYLVNG